MLSCLATEVLSLPQINKLLPVSFVSLLPLKLVFGHAGGTQHGFSFRSYCGAQEGSLFLPGC